MPTAFDRSIGQIVRAWIGGNAEAPPSFLGCGVADPQKHVPPLRLPCRVWLLLVNVRCGDPPSDVDLENRVLVSRRLEDKNESEALWSWSWSWSWSWIITWPWTFGLGLGLGLEEKVLQFFKTFVIILDDSEQGTPWHFVRDNKSSLPFGSHCLREPSALRANQPQLRGYLTMGLFVRPHRCQ